MPEEPDIADEMIDDLEPDWNQAPAHQPAEETPAEASGFGFPKGAGAPGFQFTATGSDIEKTLQAIERGEAAEEFPILDKLLNPHNPEYRTYHLDEAERQEYANTPCTPDCPHRRKGQHAARRLIADIRPPLKDRVLLAEHEIDDINHIVGALQESVTLAANKDDVKDSVHSLDTKIEAAKISVHTRIDRDILPKFEELKKAIKETESKHTLRNWALGVSLALSLIYSVILTYEKFT